MVTFRTGFQREVGGMGETEGKGMSEKSLELVNNAECMTSTSPLDSLEGHDLRQDQQGTKSCLQDPDSLSIRGLTVVGSKATLCVDGSHFRSTLCEVLEELKMRRQQYTETEEYINELVEHKREVEQHLQEEREKVESLQTRLTKQEGELMKRYEIQLRECEEDRRKALSLNEIEDTETKSLKAEVKILHMEKFAVERKLKELERNLQMANSSRENITSQMTQLRQKCADVKKELDQAVRQMEQMTNSVGTAKSLCKKLSYTNSHQECQLERCRNELETCKKTMLELQVAGKSSALTSKPTKGLKQQLMTVEHELIMEKALTSQLNGHLNELSIERKDTANALAKAQDLITSYARNGARQNTQLGDLNGELEKARERISEVTLLLEEKEEQLVKLQSDLDSKDENWENETGDIQKQLKSLQKEYTELESSHQTLLSEQQEMEETKTALLELKETLETKLGCLNEEAAEQKRSLEYTVEEVTQKYSESLNKISSLNSTIQEQASSIKNMKDRLDQFEKSKALETVRKETRSSVAIQTDGFCILKSATGELYQSRQPQQTSLPQAVSTSDETGAVTDVTVPSFVGGSTPLEGEGAVEGNFPPLTSLEPCSHERSQSERLVPTPLDTVSKDPKSSAIGMECCESSPPSTLPAKRPSQYTNDQSPISPKLAKQAEEISNEKPLSDKKATLHLGQETDAAMESLTNRSVELGNVENVSLVNKDLHQATIEPHRSQLEELPGMNEHSNKGNLNPSAITVKSELLHESTTNVHSLVLESDDDDDLMSSGISNSISSVEQFLKRDRLQCTKTLDLTLTRMKRTALADQK